MSNKQTVILFVTLLVSGISYGLMQTLAAPAKKDKLLFTIQLKILPDQPDGRKDFANVTLTNNSSSPVTIRWRTHKWSSLKLFVTSASGEVIEPSPSLYSPGDEQLTVIEGGCSMEIDKYLLKTVPNDKITDETYTVKAVYKFNGKTYESNEVKVGRK